MKRASAASLLLLAGTACAQLGNPFGPTFELQQLDPLAGGDGSLGLLVEGGYPDGQLGGVGLVLSPDLNGDGVGDAIFSFARDVDGRGLAGAAYVVFGRGPSAPTPFPAALGLFAIDGINIFRINGPKFRAGAAAVSRGDLNGDGLDDVIVYAPGAEPDGRPVGSAYVIFGRDTSISPFPPVLDLAESLDPGEGFRIDGVGRRARAHAVASVGDVNGDGFDDLVFGDQWATVDQYYPYAGESYLLFGGAEGFPEGSELSDLVADEGVTFKGFYEGDRVGNSVAAAGDVNNDGIDDFLVGARGAGRPLLPDQGAVFVVFGRDSGSGAAFPPVSYLKDLDGTDGFIIRGSGGDFARSLAKAGDLNGDGVDDIIIGATRARPLGSSDDPGGAFVVYGRDSTSGETFPAEISVQELDGADGFQLYGEADGSEFGRTVAGGADLDGDGRADIAIGAAETDPGGRVFAGTTYIIYGRDGGPGGCFPASSQIDALVGQSATAINGINARDQSGSSLAMGGDTNGDGVSDLLIGADIFDASSTTPAGQAYMVFGRHTTGSCFADLDGDGSLTLFDFLEFQSLFATGEPAADFDCDGDLTIFDFLAFQSAFSIGC